MTAGLDGTSLEQLAALNEDKPEGVEKAQENTDLSQYPTVVRLESLAGAPITHVSVGPERAQMIVR